jgi:hypothetical protein
MEEPLVVGKWHRMLGFVPTYGCKDVKVGSRWIRWKITIHL